MKGTANVSVRPADSGRFKREEEWGVTRFQSLEGIALETVYPVFLEAFSDYALPVQLSYEAFQSGLRRKGFQASVSAGAFQDGALVGFLLGGLRMWDQKLTVYDMGTGVIPRARRMGMGDRLFDTVQVQMKDRGACQYLLEVLQDNEGAYRLYEKKGFRVRRELACYRLEREACQPMRTRPVRHVERLNLEALQAFWNCQPSWQNSPETIGADWDRYWCAVAQEGDRIVGYGLIDRTGGDIPQLAVALSHRGQGAGESILAELAAHTSAAVLRVLNVEDLETRRFLTRRGFQNFANQYEMILP